MPLRLFSKYLRHDQSVKSGLKHNLLPCWSLNEKINFLDSIKLSHITVGRAVLITSLAISLGFLTLCFSNFVPTIIFGLFTCLAMIFAMIGVLITLPSILYYLKWIF